MVDRLFLYPILMAGERLYYLILVAQNMLLIQITLTLTTPAGGIYLLSLLNWAEDGWGGDSRPQLIGHD